MFESLFAEIRDSFHVEGKVHNWLISCRALCVFVQVLKIVHVPSKRVDLSFDVIEGAVCPLVLFVVGTVNNVI